MHPLWSSSWSRGHGFQLPFDLLSGNDCMHMCLCHPQYNLVPARAWRWCCAAWQVKVAWRKVKATKFNNNNNNNNNNKHTFIYRHLQENQNSSGLQTKVRYKIAQGVNYSVATKSCRLLPKMHRYFDLPLVSCMGTTCTFTLTYFTPQ